MNKQDAMIAHAAKLGFTPAKLFGNFKEYLKSEIETRTKANAKNRDDSISSVAVIGSVNGWCFIHFCGLSKNEMFGHYVNEVETFEMSSELLRKVKSDTIARQSLKVAQGFGIKVDNLLASLSKGIAAQMQAEQVAVFVMDGELKFFSCTATFANIVATKEVDIEEHFKNLKIPQLT